MNVTAKVIIPGLVLLYFMSAVNAANIDQNGVNEVTQREKQAPEFALTGIVSHNLGLIAEASLGIIPGFDVGDEVRAKLTCFLSKAYEKYEAIVQEDAEKLERAFFDGVETKVMDFSFIPTEECMSDVNVFCDPGIKELKELSPLSLCVERNLIDSAKWLLENGANANEQGLFEKAIKKIISWGRADTRVAELLLAYWARLQDDRIKALKDDITEERTRVTEIYNSDVEKGRVYRLAFLKARIDAYEEILVFLGAFLKGKIDEEFLILIQ